MSNRTKIEKFCKLNNITIIELTYIRNRDAEYGKTWDSSYWFLEAYVEGIPEEFDSYYGYGINKDVDLMIGDIGDFITTNQ